MAKGCFDVQINDFLASCNVCPVAIPETFAQTQGSGSFRERSSRKHKDPITGNSFISMDSFVTRLARKSFIVGGMTLTIEFLSLAID